MVYCQAEADLTVIDDNELCIVYYYWLCFTSVRHLVLSQMQRLNSCVHLCVYI
jgi:hypothetical protein